MNLPKCFSAIAIFSVFFMASGCKGMLPEHKLPPGYSNDWTQEAFNDIDLPMGYILLPDESFTYICPWWESVRIGRLVLLGDTRRDTMVRYYRTALESTGWLKDKETSSRHVDKTVAEFTKPERNERIILTVERTPMNKIKVELLLKPE